MIKIGFVAHGPASANSLKPLIDILRMRSLFNTHLFPFHEYVSNLWETDFTYPSDSHPEELSNMDIIVYGTGSGNPIETNVPSRYNPLGIVTISILDLFHLAEDNLRMRFPVAPNYLIVQDVKSLIDARRVVGHSCQILTHGNPHFDRLSPYVKPRKLKDNDLKIAIFTQCSTDEDYSRMSSDSLTSVFNLIDFKNSTELISEVLLKPHPREDPEFAKSICTRLGITYVDQNEDSLELMLSSDFIYGYACTLQLEAMLIGKPTSLYNKYDLSEVFKTYQDKESIPLIETFNSTIKCVSLISDVAEEILKSRI